MVNRNSWRGGLFGKGSRRRTFLKATSKVRPDSRQGAGHSSQRNSICKVLEVGESIASLQNRKGAVGLECNEGGRDGRTGGWRGC